MIDPWLPERLRHLHLAEEAETRLDGAVRAAIGRWLGEVRRLVLHGHTASAGTDTGTGTRSVTAAGPDGTGGGSNEPPPDLNAIPAADPVWQAALRDLVAPAIEDLFAERFLAEARTATISDLPYRDRHMAEVFSRLKLFPAELMEEIRPELQEALAEGEAMNLVRDRIAAVLDFDQARDAGDSHWQAESRRLQGEIHQLERELEREDLAAADRAALRRERSKLYSQLRRADQKWQWKARRIARTETLGAINGGSYAGAVARADQFGDEMFKQWLATDDARTRRDHVAADGQVKPIKAPFLVGGYELQYPCEPGGPAHEVIQCRCTALFLHADELDAEQRAQLTGPGSDAGAGAPEAVPASAATAMINRSAGQPAGQGGTTMTQTTMATTTAPAAADPGMGGDGQQPDQLPTGWRGCLAPLDTRSGDGRILANPPQLRLRTPPMALLWQPTLDDFHDGAVVAGRIDRAWIEGGKLMGEGPFDLGSPDGCEAARQLAGGWSNGISVDVDDVVAEEAWYDAQGNPIPPSVIEGSDWEEIEALFEAGARPVMVLTDWRLMTATMVAQPAFDEARLEAVYDYAPAAGAAGGTAAAAVVAAVVGDTSLPIGDRGTKWDGAAAQTRIFEAYTDADGKVDTAAVAKAYLYRDDSADASTKAAYKLPFADIVNGELTIIPQGVSGCAGGRGVDSTTGISDADKGKIKTRICELYGKIKDEYSDWPDCPFAGETASAAAPAASRAASAVQAIADERVYPAEWFADPGLTRYTAVTITEDGRLSGHLAPWQIDGQPSCHIGLPDMCTQPPASASEYAFFHVGEVQTTAGPLPIGRITLGTGHADLRLGFRPAADHYDNTGSCVAVVRAGEDDHGIWVAGALVDEVTPAQVSALRRSGLSGDWRRIGGNLELVAALCVNTPGYPVPRTLAASAGSRQVSLIAGAGLAQRRRSDRGRSLIDYERLARLVAHETQLIERRSRRVTELAARLGRGRRPMTGLPDVTERLAALDARRGTAGPVTSREAAR